MQTSPDGKFHTRVGMIAGFIFRDGQSHQGIQVPHQAVVYGLGLMSDMANGSFAKIDNLIVHFGSGLDPELKYFGTRDFDHFADVDISQVVVLATCFHFVPHGSIFKCQLPNESLWLRDNYRVAYCCK